MALPEVPEGSIRVAVFADFVCPYSFLACEQIDRFSRQYDLTVWWRPHWLHPDTPREGTPRGSGPESRAQRERFDAWMKEMAPEQYARMKPQNKRAYSLFAFEAMEFACDRGLELPLKTAIYELQWVHGRDIGEPETLLEAAQVSGLDPVELANAFVERSYAARALDAVEQARRIGITNTPTMFLGTTRINGWHYDEVIETLLAKHGARRREMQPS
jgi:predicted DsbA family dithiol-disulfide isomerase